VTKKIIIMIAGAGLVSFAATFGLTWFTAAKAQPQVQELPPPTESAVVIQEDEETEPVPEPVATGRIEPYDNITTISVTEQKLKTLIYDVRRKKQEYDDKLESLVVREQRLKLAHDITRKNIEQLNKLQDELASTIQILKDERDKLLKSKIEIKNTEKINLQAIAAAYNKMDPAKASKILTGMSQTRKDPGGDSLDDAVKILHFMSERTKAKLLAELVDSEPKLATILCQKLKHLIIEE